MKITVLDSNGMESTTYRRRAKQLVLKGRAAWVDDMTIVLTGREEQMDNDAAQEIPQEIPQAVQPNLSDQNDKDEQETDRLLLHIAKQNVAYKKNLIINVLWLVPGGVVTVILSDLTREMFFLGMYSLWFFYTMFRIVRLVLPKVRAKFLASSDEDPIEIEYKRLKALEARRA